MCCQRLLLSFLCLCFVVADVLNPLATSLRRVIAKHDLVKLRFRALRSMSPKGQSSPCMQVGELACVCLPPFPFEFVMEDYGNRNRCQGPILKTFKILHHSSINMMFLWKLSARIFSPYLESKGKMLENCKNKKRKQKEKKGTKYSAIFSWRPTLITGPAKQGLCKVHLLLLSTRWPTIESNNLNPKLKICRLFRILSHFRSHARARAINTAAHSDR